MRYRVWAATKDSGVESSMEIEANSSTEAADEANRRGFFVSNVAPVDSTDPDQHRGRSHPRSFVTLTRRMVAFGSIVAAIACAAIIALLQWNRPRYTLTVAVTERHDASRESVPSQGDLALLVPAGGRVDAMLAEYRLRMRDAVTTAIAARKEIEAIRRRCSMLNAETDTIAELAPLRSARTALEIVDEFARTRDALGKIQDELMQHIETLADLEKRETVAVMDVRQLQETYRAKVNAGGDQPPPVVCDSAGRAAFTRIRLRRAVIIVVSRPDAPVPRLLRREVDLEVTSDAVLSDGDDVLLTEK